MDNLFFNGISIMAVCLGLVELSKKLGVSGEKWLTLESAVLGGVLAVCGYIAEKGVPKDYAGWFGLALFGVMAGLSASGIYKVATKSADKSEDKAVQ